jgi:hypothetical protein
VARLIGVSRPTLYDLLRQHGLRDDPPARTRSGVTVDPI